MSQMPYDPRNYDASKVSRGTGVTDGEYTFEVVEVNEKVTQDGGRAYWNMKLGFNIPGRDSLYHVYKSLFFDNNNSLDAVMKFCASCGFDFNQPPTISQVWGARGTAFLKKEVRADKRNYGYMQVFYFIDPNEPKGGNPYQKNSQAPQGQQQQQQFNPQNQQGQHQSPHQSPHQQQGHQQQNQQQQNFSTPAPRPQQPQTQQQQPRQSFNDIDDIPF